MLKLALCQLNVTADKTDNLKRAREMLLRAADRGAQMAILPEMFTITYETRLFHGAAEPCPGGETAQMLETTARETGLFIIGGSVPELKEDKLYNTSMCFDAQGRYLGKYRKAHLFDVDVPKAGYRFMESETVAPGEKYPLLLDGPVKTAVGICFDIRFPEWSRLMMDRGADLIALPASFARTTGPRHWELLLRARALDNQVFIAGVSPAQSKNAYGHSLVATPDGTVLYDCGEEEALAVVELDLGLLEELRSSIPVGKNRRKDLYRVDRCVMK